MDLKIVSGVLVTTGHKSGQVVIDYSSNKIVSGDLDASKLQKERLIAPTTPIDMRAWYFDSVPCHTISLRQIKAAFLDEDNFGSRPSRMRTNSFNIGSDSTSTRLTITWDGPSDGGIEEISYLAIGSVISPPPGPH